MLGGYTPLSALLLAAVLVGGVSGLGIAGVAWRRRDQPGAAAFAVFVLGMSLWCLSTAVLWLSDPLWLSYVAQATTTAAAVVALGSWVVFTARYTGSDDVLRGPWGKLFGSFLAVLLVVALTNPLHQLYFANLRPASYAGLSLIGFDPTPLFLVFSVGIYGPLLWSYWVLGQFYRSALAGERRQAGLILFADLLFVGTTLLYYIGGFSLHPALDPSPVIFFVTVVIIAYALFYYDFLDVAPLATDLLLEEMQDPVLIVDEDGTIVEHNGSAATLLLGDEPDESLSTHLPALAGDGDVPSETEVVRDGTRRTYDVNVSPVYDQHDRERGRLVVLRDITAQKEQQVALERQNERLDEFASVVSHDLRNPLQVASGHAEVAVETGEVGHVERVVSALDEMERLIEDLLELARSGRRIEDTQNVRLADAATEAWASVETGGAQLRVDSDGSVSADPERFEQLLGNLYRNAVEHGVAESDGSGVDEDDLVVTVGTLDDGRGVYVADNGRGIPAEDRGRVFESGFTTASNGTGFGLDIVGTIVEGHGWSVTVTDSDEGGARFDIRTDS